MCIILMYYNLGLVHLYFSILRRFCPFFFFFFFFLRFSKESLCPLFSAPSYATDNLSKM